MYICFGQDVTAIAIETHFIDIFKAHLDKLGRSYLMDTTLADSYFNPSSLRKDRIFGVTGWRGGGARQHSRSHLGTRHSVHREFVRFYAFKLSVGTNYRQEQNVQLGLFGRHGDKGLHDR